MPNKKSRKNTSTTQNKKSVEVVDNTKETDAHHLLPDYKPIDFSAPQPHLDLINKKIRGTRKKLRKINDVEKALANGKTKNITKEQQDVLANKASVERSLAEYEEIRKSVEKVDISAQLRLLLGVFFCCC
mmetsp:Transcript_45672/g.69838  ORF Transcript_45672/g.69838 Transcript_45672/m.69838 type:complete len:130 (+) Transcript_45672:55-444(+)